MNSKHGANANFYLNAPVPYAGWLAPAVLIAYLGVSGRRIAWTITLLGVYQLIVTSKKQAKCNN